MQLHGSEVKSVSSYLCSVNGREKGSPEQIFLWQFGYDRRGAKAHLRTGESLSSIPSSPPPYCAGIPTQSYPLQSNRTVTGHRAVDRNSSLPLSLVRLQENTLPVSTDKPSILSPPSERTKAISSGGAGRPLIVWV